MKHPVGVHTQAAILCHVYRGAFTLILTGNLSSCPDIPEAQEDCLCVLFPDAHLSPKFTRIRD